MFIQYFINFFRKKVLTKNQSIRKKVLTKKIFTKYLQKRKIEFKTTFYFFI